MKTLLITIALSIFVISSASAQEWQLLAGEGNTTSIGQEALPSTYEKYAAESPDLYESESARAIYPQASSYITNYDDPTDAAPEQQFYYDDTSGCLFEATGFIDVSNRISGEGAESDETTCQEVYELTSDDRQASTCNPSTENVLYNETEDTYFIYIKVACDE